MRWTISAWVLCATTVGCGNVFPYEVPAHETGAQCDNGDDDDLDGVADCEDPDCFSACPEHGLSQCLDLLDNDGDGLVDYEETACWKYAEIATGPFGEDGEVLDCSSSQASLLALAAEQTWTGSGKWVADPVGGGDTVLELEGGPGCWGSGIATGSCDELRAEPSSTGGACFSLDFEVSLGSGDDSEVVTVLAPEFPELGASLLSSGDAILLSYRQRTQPDGSTSAEVRLSAGGTEVQRTLSGPAGNWLELSLRSGAGSDCSEWGPLELAASDENGAELATIGPEEGVAPPPAWPVTKALRVGVQAAAPGLSWVRTLSLQREAFDPCGYPVPQIDVPAVVVGAAADDSRICMVGAITASPVRKRVYDPNIQQGWPPELPGGTPERAFRSWHAERAREIRHVDGPFEAVLPKANVRSGELAYNAAERVFEGVLLVSDTPREGGTLVMIRSADCEHWQAAPLTDLGLPVAAAHPIRFSIDADGTRHLTLAVPGEGYSEDLFYGSPVCSKGEPAGLPGFSADADQVVYIKPGKNPCVRFPRGGLFDTTSHDGARWDPVGAEYAALPAFNDLIMGCGCVGREAELPARGAALEVHQLLEFGGTPAFVSSGVQGAEVVIDLYPKEGADGAILADAELLPGSLRAPTGRLGTFDAELVGSPQILLLSQVGDLQRIDGLLFYRGFGSVAKEGDDVEILRGGEVGIVPFRIK